MNTIRHTENCFDSMRLHIANVFAPSEYLDGILQRFGWKFRQKVAPKISSELGATRKRCLHRTPLSFAFINTKAHQKHVC